MSLSTDNGRRTAVVVVWAISSGLKMAYFELVEAAPTPATTTRGSNGWRTSNTCLSSRTRASRGGRGTALVRSLTERCIGSCSGARVAGRVSEVVAVLGFGERGSMRGSDERGVERGSGAPDTGLRTEEPVTGRCSGDRVAGRETWRDAEDAEEEGFPGSLESLGRRSPIATSLYSTHALH